MIDKNRSSYAKAPLLRSKSSGGQAADRYDEDVIRERLYTYLDNHLDHPPTYWALRIGITPVTIQAFLRRAKKAQRNTLVRIKNFLDEKEIKPIT